MSKRRKENRRAKLLKPRPAKQGLLGPLVGVLAVAILGPLGIWWWQFEPVDIPPGKKPLSEASAPSSAGSVNQVEFDKLRGRWQRPDGGYVLEIKSIANSGAMDAGYFNPNSIHVARAEASREGDAVKVFIELRDVNYPGSTYTLVYDPAGDRLKGIYYQAVAQQRFPVSFVRMN